MISFGKFQTIVSDLTHKEQGEGTPWGLGTQQSDRLRAVASECALFWEGDFVEIGCCAGNTTLQLARVARRFGRRVLAVDPWAEDEAVYERFVENTRECSDIIDVVRLPSQNEQAIEQIKARSLCFAFVDGLHTHEALLSDIVTVGHCKGVVAVDDVGYACEPEDLRPAFFEGAQMIGRGVYWHPRCREGYLL